MTRVDRPFTLLDTDLHLGLSPKDWYGSDHTPRLPTDPAERLLAYHAATTYLQEAFTKYNGRYVLTALSLLRVGVGRRDQRETDPIEAEVELAQAFFLKYRGGQEIPTPAAIREILQKLKLHMLLFLEVTSKPDDGDRADLLERRRFDTLVVRHTFYPNQARRIHSAIAAEFGGRRLHDVDLTVAEISELAFLLAGLLIRFVEPFVSTCEEWLKGESPSDFDNWLRHFWIPVEHLAAAIKKSERDISHLFREWSLEPGSLATTRLEHLHLDNPVWGQPLLAADDLFFGFNPNVFVAFHSDVLSTVLRPKIPKFSEKLGQARGSVLERELHALLRTMFPSAEILENAKWTDPANNRQYESDAIVLFDELMLIFEAKGGALDPKSRRGSQTLMHDLEKLFVEAAVQSHRLREVFYSHPEVFEFHLGTVSKTVRRGDVRRVGRFGVALERLVTTSMGLMPAVENSIRDTGSEPMPMMTIGDLEQLATLLRTESERLHYLLRREEIDAEADFIADELDLIAMYLKSGFTGFQDHEGGRRVFHIYGLSDLLRFYQRNEFYYDPRIAFPQRTTLVWDRLIAALETRKPPGWTSVVYDLLNVPLASQQKFEKDIRAACRRVRLTTREGIARITMQVPFQKYPSSLVCAVTAIRSPAGRSFALREQFLDWCRQHPDERAIFLVRDGLNPRSQPEFADYYSKGWVPGRWTATVGAENFPR
jgi:hypothetical protein